MNYLYLLIVNVIKFLSELKIVAKIQINNAVLQ